MKIKYFIIILFLITSCAYSQDNRPFTFISSIGGSVRQSEVRAHNIAYMNNLKVLSYNTYKSGNTWVSVVKVVPK